jgi:hypothetical protein
MVRFLSASYRNSCKQRSLGRSYQWWGAVRPPEASFPARIVHKLGKAAAWN